MITDSVHELTPVLSQSLQEARSMLESRHLGNAAGVPVNPDEKPPAATEPEPGRDLVDRFADHAQVKRDAARQAAVFTMGLQNEKQQTAVLLDSISTSSQDSEQGNSGPDPVSPAEVYRSTMQYQRREDLVAAFEKAAAPDPERAHINIVV